MLADENDPDRVILVLPFLRRIDRPYPASVRECVDFVGQTLEGLAFMHENGVAHRDCSWRNIMMDGRSLFLKGWHPQADHKLPDGKLIWNDTPSRTACGGVRYHFIDFGISTKDANMTVGRAGQIRVPELSNDVPYNPYKLDVYILGKAYQDYLVKKIEGVDFVLPLITYMTPENPEDRPTAAQCVTRFNEMRAKMGRAKLLQRTPLYEAREGIVPRFIKGTYRLVCEGWWAVKSRSGLKSLHEYYSLED